MTSHSNTVDLPKVAAGQGIDAQPRKGLSALAVDDEPGMRHFLEKALETRFARVDTAGSVEMAQALFDGHDYSTVVLDVSLPGKSGLQWLNELRQGGYEGDVILITGYADMDTAIGALRAGAQDFLQKPFRIDQLWYALDRAADQNRLKRENFVLKRAVSNLQQNEQVMVGESPIVCQLRKLVAKVAPTDSTVLLTGESGSGKEVLARTLHGMSLRSERPFVPINCGAISPELIESELFGHAKGAFTGANESHQGLFYYAQGGTLFLDEIGELPLSMQTKLLRVLEDRRIRPVGSTKEVDVDVRIVAATNVNLDVEVKRGRFRQDLYYRLQVMPIEMPPLRSRPEDIELLANYFIKVFAKKLRIDPLKISPDMLARLQAYEWPGNVRELRNFIERSLILGYFPKEDLPLNLDLDEREHTAEDPQNESLEQVEKAHILRVLNACSGNKSEAARRLGVSRKTLERKCMAWSQE
ncbi:sigma-54 dependent transcriptional regulator [Limnobacter sp.]|uniref:sigma-54-dependent transcriptional regulator n=2 Tax=unclassified Limnobacter TaxID=2630203 RepID=UPI0027367D1E|nr:sigma-54 dependent transcriptional regulator [Limnobacter sp.]MDP3270504.1 sigma-54 dependent transcriptional regulator [Limnobacter sp.]